MTTASTPKYASDGESRTPRLKRVFSALSVVWKAVSTAGNRPMADEAGTALLVGGTKPFRMSTPAEYLRRGPRREWPGAQRQVIETNDRAGLHRANPTTGCPSDVPNGIQTRVAQIWRNP